MKITFVTETYPPEINGVALTVLSLVQHCRKLGHHAEVVRPKQPTDLLKAPERLIVEQLVPGVQLPFYAGALAELFQTLSHLDCIANRETQGAHNAPEYKRV